MPRLSLTAASPVDCRNYFLCHHDVDNKHRKTSICHSGVCVSVYPLAVLAGGAWLLKPPCLIYCLKSGAEPLQKKRDMEALCTQWWSHWGAVKHKQPFLSIMADQIGTGARRQAGRPGRPGKKSPILLQINYMLRFMFKANRLMFLLKDYHLR